MYVKEVRRLVEFCQQQPPFDLVVVTGSAGSGKSGVCQLVAGLLDIKCRRHSTSNKVVRYASVDGDAFCYRNNYGNWVVDIAMFIDVLKTLKSMSVVPVVAVSAYNVDDLPEALRGQGLNVISVYTHRPVDWFNDVYKARLNERGSQRASEWLSKPRDWKRNNLRDAERRHTAKWRASFSLNLSTLRFPEEGGRSKYFDTYFGLDFTGKLVYFGFLEGDGSRELQRGRYGAINVISRAPAARRIDEERLLHMKASGVSSVVVTHAVKISQGWKSDELVPRVKIQTDAINILERVRDTERGPLPISVALSKSKEVSND